MTTRRDLIKGIGLTVATGGLLSLLVGCKDNLLKWAELVIQTLTELLPILASLVPGSEDVINKAIAVAKELQEALKNKAPNTLDFLEQLVAPDGLFNKIVDIVGLVVDPQTRALLSGSLAIIGLALRLIEAQLGQTNQLKRASDGAVLEKILGEVKF